MLNKGAMPTLEKKDLRWCAADFPAHATGGLFYSSCHDNTITLLPAPPAQSVFPAQELTS